MQSESVAILIGTDDGSETEFRLNAYLKFTFGYFSLVVAMLPPAGYCGTNGQFSWLHQDLVQVQDNLPRRNAVRREMHLGLL